MSTLPGIRLLRLIAVLVATAVTGTARQTLPLPIGKSEAGQATSDALAVYQFTAATGYRVSSSLIE